MGGGSSWRRGAALAGSATVLIGVLGVYAPPATAGPPAPIAAGTVTDSIRPATAPQGAAIVHLFALPNQQALDAAPVGSSVPLLEVGWARTQSDGTFSIPVDPAALPSDIEDSNGGVNLEIVTSWQGKQLAYQYNAHYNTDSASESPIGWVMTSDGQSPDAAPTFAFGMSAGTVSISHNDPANWLGADEAPLGAAGASAHAVLVTATTPAVEHMNAALPANVDEASLGGPHSDTLVPVAEYDSTLSGSVGPATTASVTPDVDRCALQKTSTVYRDRKEHFTTTETMTGFPETVRESASAKHTLGVAVKGTYSTGPWTASGSMSIERSAAHSASTTYSTTHTVFNRVNYRKWLEPCLSQARRLPEGFYDILTADGSNVSEKWFYHCGRHQPGDTWDTATATNITYGVGVDLGVISVSAQSGYSSSLNLHYKFNKYGEVCGGNVDGPLWSPRVEVDNGGW